MKRLFHLGLDYGTSAAKLVLRELDTPGGSRAHVIKWKGSYRIPSTVVSAGAVQLQPCVHGSAD